MQRRNWQGSALFIVFSFSSVGLLALALLSLVELPFLSSTGTLPWLVLLVLTFAASRFTVSVISADGLSESRKSVADALVFLAVMIYAVPPAGSAGPATILAALVGFLSTYRLNNRRQVILTTATAVISTFICASCYGFLVGVFANQAHFDLETGLPLNVFLGPLCVLALLQYFLSTLATAIFLSIDTGRAVVRPSQESIVWTMTSQVAGAASAVLFYSAIRGGGIPFVGLGLLITALVHLLYRFNEKRVQEVRRAELEQRRHIEEMAVIHMNTIESLAIAIDAKDQTTHGHVRRTQIYA